MNQIIEKFERPPQSHQLSTTFNSTIEEIIETPETAEIYMTSSNSIIEPIVHNNFVNTFQHKNG